jgi:hypothetical protein
MDMSAHASHELVEIVAALILTIGGAIVLVLAAIDGHRSRVPTAGAVGSAPASRMDRPGLAFSSFRRTEVLLAAGLSAGAAAIHMAAAPAHVEELGDLGLAFYWAALFQAGYAFVLAVRPLSSRTAWIGIGANLAFVGAWAFTRTVGLPMVGEGPEAIGVADATTVGLQLALIALLVVRLAALDIRLLRGRSGGMIRSLATTSLVAVLSVVVLSSTIAVKDAFAGHHDGADPGHEMPALMSGMDHGAMGPAIAP